MGKVLRCAAVLVAAVILLGVLWWAVGHTTVGKALLDGLSAAPVGGPTPAQIEAMEADASSSHSPRRDTDPEARAKPAPKAKAVVPVADHWIVSDCGDVSYRGVYNKAGTYWGKDYYQLGSGASARYLFWHGGYSTWALNDVLGPEPPIPPGTPYIGTMPSADLPANPWGNSVANGGVAPAPTVAAADLTVQIITGPSPAGTKGDPLHDYVDTLTLTVRIIDVDGLHRTGQLRVYPANPPGAMFYTLSLSDGMWSWTGTEWQVDVEVSVSPAELRAAMQAVGQEAWSGASYDLAAYYDAGVGHQAWDEVLPYNIDYAPTYSATQPLFLTTRRDRMVGHDQPLKVKFGFGFADTSPPSNDCTWVLLIDETEAATGVIHTGDWSVPGPPYPCYYDTERDFPAGTYSPGAHTIRTELSV